MKRVSHQQACQLLHNKFVVVLGDSIQRSIYKDLVMLLQTDRHLSLKQLRARGEMTFEQDCLVEGGSLMQLHNGTEYREVRQFRTDHHLVRFYFVTCIYSSYMRSILEDFRQGLKPDLVIANSCIWDISRYSRKWNNDYKNNLHKFFDELQDTLPKETLVIWNLAMPLGEKIKGGFLVPEVEHIAFQLRFDVIEGNCYSGTLANAYGMDVLDLHFQFRLSLRHRTKDGVHWDALAHRRITYLLLQHVAQAWGVLLTVPLAEAEKTKRIQLPTSDSASDHGDCKPRVKSSISIEFPVNNQPYGDFHSNNSPGPLIFNQESPRLYRPPLPPPPVRSRPTPRRSSSYDLNDGPSHYSERYRALPHQLVMRSRHTRHHYAPYTDHRPVHHGWYDFF